MKARETVDGVAQLLNRYVNEVLNAGQSESVLQLFSSDYRDYDPLNIPGVITPRHSPESRQHILRQVALISNPSVDLRFTLEDFAISGNRAGYRIFGEGTVPVGAEGRDERAEQLGDKMIRKLSIPNTGLRIDFVKSAPGILVMDRLHVIYKCVGMFAIINEKFSERWGLASVT